MYAAFYAHMRDAVSHIVHFQKGLNTLFKGYLQEQWRPCRLMSRDVARHD
jgi:hypothetical protein